MKDYEIPAAANSESDLELMVALRIFVRSGFMTGVHRAAIHCIAYNRTQPTPRRPPADLRYVGWIRADAAFNPLQRLAAGLILSTMGQIAPINILEMALGAGAHETDRVHADLGSAACVGKLSAARHVEFRKLDHTSTLFVCRRYGG